MKTSTTINSLARIYVSSMKLGGAGKCFAPGKSFGSLAGTVWAHLSSQASEANLRKLGNQLAAIARSAHLARQPDVVDWATQAIVDLPLPSEFRSIADFYRAYRQRQQGEIHRSRIVFARIADEAAPGFRERAMLVLGISQFTAGDLQGAARYYLETARAAQGIDLLTSTQASWNLAIVRGADGDHHGALHDLERLAPVIRIIGQHQPTLYHDYLNSLAVEMSAVGRNREAKQIITKLLALPTARRSPAWRETADEIAVNEARGVCCPLTFAIWSATDAASTPEALPARVMSRASVVTNPGIDAPSTADRLSAAVTTNSLAETAPPPRQRSRVVRVCSIDWGVAWSKIHIEVAIARSVANLQTGLAPIPGERLPSRSREARPAKRVRNRQPESVPVSDEYPRFPLPRVAPGLRCFCAEEAQASIRTDPSIHARGPPRVSTPSRPLRQHTIPRGRAPPMNVQAQVTCGWQELLRLSRPSSALPQLPAETWKISSGQNNTVRAILTSRGPPHRDHGHLGPLRPPQPLFPPPVHHVRPPSHGLGRARSNLSEKPSQRRCKLPDGRKLPAHECVRGDSDPCASAGHTFRRPPNLH
jgi:hypothetical protein